MLNGLREALARHDYETAVQNVNLILYRYPQQQEARKLGVQAYAGRAGLRSWDLLKSLDSVGEGTYFRIMAEHFIKVDQRTLFDLEAASSLVSGRKADGFEEELWELALAAGNFGASLHLYAYDSNGVLKENFDACELKIMPESAVQEIVRHFSRLLRVADLPSIGPDLTPLTSNPWVSNFFEANQLELMRSLLNEGYEGLGLGSGLVRTCP